MVTHRIVVCGPPREGKKVLLQALARHAVSSSALQVSETPTGAYRASMMLTFSDLGVVAFETIHGPAFYLEQEIKMVFATPAAVVIYVLRQRDPEGRYTTTARECEQEYLSWYSSASRAAASDWNDVPWLWVKMITYRGSDAVAAWGTDGIPDEILRDTITIDLVKGIGVATLFTAVEAAFGRVVVQP